MSSPVYPPTDDDLLPEFCAWTLALGLILLLVGNLPWRLDDYGQTDLAMAAFQVVNSAPASASPDAPVVGLSAQPPLPTVLAAAAFQGLGLFSFELGWRSPSLICTILLIAAAWRAGAGLIGSNIGGMLAGGAVCLNPLTARIATLVTPDALGALLIFLIGWLIMEKSRPSRVWTLRDRWLLAGLFLLAGLTLGLPAFAIFLPGMVAFVWIRRDARALLHLTGNVWPVIIGACGLIAWLVAGPMLGLVWNSPSTLELLAGSEAVKFSLPGRSTLGLATGFLPWSLLLFGIFASKRVRRELSEDDGLLWVACWGLGSLVFLDLFPVGRFERCFLALPPFALLLPAAARHLPLLRFRGEPLGRFTVLAVLVSLGATAVATGVDILAARHRHADALSSFGHDVRHLVLRPERLEVIDPPDQKLVLYARKPRSLSIEEVLPRWQVGETEWLVISSDDLAQYGTELEPYEVAAPTKLGGMERVPYRLISRVPVGRDPLLPLRHKAAATPSPNHPSLPQPTPADKGTPTPRPSPTPAGPLWAPRPG